MANEIIRQQEIQDHKDLMEKLRECCNRLDELFAVYDLLQLAVPDHNESRSSHRDIRETIIALDERESDRYMEVVNSIRTKSQELNDLITQLRSDTTDADNRLQQDLEHAQTVLDSVTEGNFTYSDPIVSEVRSRTFANGNAGEAVIDAVGAHGYNMLFRIKSTNGVFTGGAYNTKYQVNYAGNTTLAGNANRVDKSNVLIDENGNATFCNNVTVANTVTAATLTGHVTEQVDNAVHADEADHAVLGSALTSNDNSNALAANQLIYTSGQMAGYSGSNNSSTTMSYPSNATAVNAGGIANIQNLRLLWGASSGYWHDLFVSPNQRYIWHRDVRNGTANAWTRIVEEDGTSWNISISGNAQSANVAINANHAVSADKATQATNATNATNANLAVNANHAVNADNAVNAQNATYAAAAGHATTADSATNAATANVAIKDGANNTITTYYVTLSTTQTISGNKTFTGTNSFNNVVSVTSTNPTMKYTNTSVNKGTVPSGNVTLSSINFTDAGGNRLGYINDTINTAGKSATAIANLNLDGTHTAEIAIVHNTKNATTAEAVLTNVTRVIPDVSGNIDLGSNSNKIGTIYSKSLILDNDGVGTVKLLAREYTNNSTNSAYSNVSGSSLYAVSFTSSSVTVSGSLTRANCALVIDHNSPQSGTWQPIQQLSGSWRSGGNYIIGLYRRIL